jgi:hypothetical protein
VWRRVLVAGLFFLPVLAYLVGYLAKLAFVGPAVLLATGVLSLLLPHLVKRKCPACGAKSLRQIRPGLFQESLDCTCPCGYRYESGVLVKTSWGVVAALLAFAVLFAAYLIVRYGR